MDIQVEIVTPERSVFSGPSSEIVVSGREGEFGVLPQHDRFLSLLKCGVVRVGTQDGVQKFLVGRGFAEVDGAQVTILTESCVLVDAVDKAQATTDLAEATALLQSSEFNSEAYKQADAKREMAQAQLDA